MSSRELPKYLTRLIDARLIADSNVQAAVNENLQKGGVAFLDAHRSRTDIALTGLAVLDRFPIEYLTVPAGTSHYRHPLEGPAMRMIGGLPYIDVMEVIRQEDKGRTSSDHFEQRGSINDQYVNAWKDRARIPFQALLLAPGASRKPKFPIKHGVHTMLVANRTPCYATYTVRGVTLLKPFALSGDFDSDTQNLVELYSNMRTRLGIPTSALL